MNVFCGHMEIKPRVQKGLKLIEERRFQKEVLWTAKMSVLDDETVELPLIKRKALAIKKILSETPVEIGNHELIVGSGIPGARGYGQGYFPEYATQQEIDVAAKNFVGPKSVFGHSSPYYPKYLKLGVSGLKKLVEEKLHEVRRKGSAPQKETWYEGVIISLDGLSNFIQRHGEMALKLAAGETDVTRKIELRTIADISHHLFQGPPENFREAIQALWFAHIAFRNTMNYLPLGRFDQNLWPFLKVPRPMPRPPFLE